MVGNLGHASALGIRGGGVWKFNAAFEVDLSASLWWLFALHLPHSILLE